MSKNNRLKKRNPLTQSFLIILAIFWAIPLLILLMDVFKSTEEIKSNPFGFPKELYFDSMLDALTNPNRTVWELYFNTAVCTFGGMFFTIVFGAMASYYIARAKTKLAEFLRNYFFLGMVLPSVLTIVSLALVLRWLGLMGKGHLTLIILYTAGMLPFCIYVFTSFIEGLPRELEYAAAIDGASKMQIFWKVVFPLLKPATATLAMYIGVVNWNNFMTPKLYGGGMETVSLGIYNALGSYTSDWSRVFTWVFLASVPAVVAFLCLQKYYIEGMAGAVKG